MSAIEPARRLDVTPAPQRLSRATQRTLGRIEESTLVRQARLLGEEYLDNQKLAAVSHLTKSAMLHHANETHLKRALAGADPIAEDALDYYLGLAKVARGELIIDAVHKYRDI